MTQILDHFGSFFRPPDNDFYHLLDYLAAQAGPEKMYFVAECKWNKS